MTIPFEFSRNDNPAPRRRCPPIRQVGAVDQLTVIVLSEKCFGIECHWDGRKLVPCSAEKNLCQFCYCHSPKKWRGYLHCLQEAQNATFFIELTDHAHERLKRVTADYATFRGLVIGLQRERKTVKSPIAVNLVGTTPPAKALPPEISPEETLKRLFRIIKTD